MKTKSLISVFVSMIITVALLTTNTSAYYSGQKKTFEHSFELGSSTSSFYISITHQTGVTVNSVKVNGAIMQSYIPNIVSWSDTGTIFTFIFYDYLPQGSKIEIIWNSPVDIANPFNSVYFSPTNISVSYTQYLLGDVNLDGEITSSDTTLLAKVISGKATLNSQQIKNANVNGGGLNAEDLLLITKFVTGEIFSF